ncbi:uncharacterized protein LOC110460825 [Mizuhopecten yessoensis]|uniref:Uncharacterized protein n=1 Tax=Mizuhopecten yessoensis TaxID=6573 RepID=A0A210Q1M2_MIZYE|nr:uncharacterized protein LOC110460825 [Mizuhopecten yessoensis]OWF42622.1 hypothetical protein KP79_PYT14816 [Mizuhopecten yessoensis]
MNRHWCICKVVTTLVLLVWRPDRSSAGLCNDTLYAEECNTWLSGSGIIEVEPICRNGTIQWHKCQNHNLTLKMTKYEAFRMCFRFDKIPYNIIDTTNRRNVPKNPPKKDSPTCVLSRPVSNRKETLELRFEPGSPGSMFLINIPFTVNKVSLPKVPYG